MLVQRLGRLLLVVKRPGEPLDLAALGRRRAVGQAGDGLIYGGATRIVLGAQLAFEIGDELLGLGIRTFGGFPNGLLDRLYLACRDVAQQRDLAIDVGLRDAGQAALLRGGFEVAGQGAVDRGDLLGRVRRGLDLLGLKRLDARRDRLGVAFPLGRAPAGLGPVLLGVQRRDLAFPLATRSSISAVRRSTLDFAASVAWPIRSPYSGSQMTSPDCSSARRCLASARFAHLCRDLPADIGALASRACDRAHG